jgi:hypothetical protein
VRMAIHSGKVELRERDYYGPTVNRCARLRAVGHGGQVLLSGVSAQLIQDQLPPGMGLLDLGMHELKDLSTPEHVWQLRHHRLQAEFPPLVGWSPPPAALEPAPAPPSLRVRTARRYFLLTDQLNRTPDGRVWQPNITHTAEGSSQGFHCYATPQLAALLNVANERMRSPRLWELEVHDVAPDTDEFDVISSEATAIDSVPMPTVGAYEFARFAVLCAREAFSGGLLGIEFQSWANGWLAGQDRTGQEARVLAGALESEAYRAGGYMHPEMLAAAYAARAAVNAARTVYLGGRAREEETRRIAELAAEAVHLASRVARLDLVALADVAVPEQRVAIGSVPPSRAAWQVA